ncbi:MAG: hypothetical protein A2W90_20735 [Bacteroidetes bacterium GWF2_42_66]|nr:MAG: hypothetical protein A2W89_03415 [Bacteroidetes bacterium GWE2_42_39]OFY40566.1 MAG: hypothetical protein A2W90_20735 [Bacteroidetes bacterium GWF2_42_66]HCR90356.1 hypothetical protein [Prolixibacteraceae bacterium]
MFLLAGVSCSRNPLKIDVSEISLDLTINHFERDLADLPVDSAKINFLSGKYGEFFDIFTRRMIWIGGPEEENFTANLQKFATDTLIVKLNGLVAEKIDSEQLQTDLETAFKHYKFYFPEKEIPRIASCVSGFNQSIVTADQLIGISLDKFLGSDSPYYAQLGLPEYKRRRMNPENILPETMMAWAITEFPKNDEGTNLLSNIIYQGKLMYFLDAMLPSLHDSLKIGYTQKQLDFCIKSEAGMWAFLAEHKLLFSSQRMDVKRYIDDGPFTNSFTNESPGRTGVWLGWQIVRAYMKKNPEVSLSQLMQNQNHQEILSRSGYQPG